MIKIDKKGFFRYFFIEYIDIRYKTIENIEILLSSFD